MAAGEPLAGTGKHPSRILLLRWPKGRWSRSIFDARDMTEAERTAIAALRETGLRVQLVDRKDDAPGQHRLWLYPEGQSRAVPRDGLVPALQALARGDLSGWETAGCRMLLVCTHGQKDRCCARWGFAAYRAARDAARADVQVWESTHLGGCRLSATTLGLPAMTKHGRVAPSDMPELLAAEAAGRPLPRRWRGPCDLAPADQAAAVAAARWVGAEGGTPGTPSGSGASRRVTVARPDGPLTLDMQLAAGTVSRPGTCDDMDAGTVVDAPAWRVTRIGPAAPD